MFYFFYVGCAADRDGPRRFPWGGCTFSSTNKPGWSLAESFLPKPLAVSAKIRTFAPGMSIKKKAQQISFIIHDDTLYRASRLLGITAPESVSLQVLGNTLKKRVVLSLLTTMPRPLKVYGDTVPTYEEWMCDRLNRDRHRPLARLGKSEFDYLEVKTAELLRMEGSRRKPGEIYKTYVENLHAVLSRVLREYGVNTRNQWMSDRFGFNDSRVDDLRIVTDSSHPKSMTVVLSLKSNEDLTLYVNDVRQWLSGFKSKCSVVYIPPQG